MTDERQETKTELPEAAASATVKIKSPQNFEYLFTVRDMSSKTLLFKIDALEKHFIANGFTPIPQNYGKFNATVPQTPTKECILHKVSMKQKISRKSGKPYFSHYIGVYPNGINCFGEIQQITSQEEYGASQDY